MDAVTAARILITVYPTVKKVSETRKAIKKAKQERKFFEDMKAATEAKNAKPEIIRVTCEVLRSN